MANSTRLSQIGNKIEKHRLMLYMILNSLLLSLYRQLKNKRINNPRKHHNRMYLPISSLNQNKAVL